MNENKPGWKYKTLEFQPKTYMLKYRVDQQLIVLNLNFVSINRILVTVKDCESFAESKFDAKNK